MEIWFCMELINLSMGVRNYEYLYENYGCMDTCLGCKGFVKFRMEKCRFCIIVWICVVLV